MSFLPQFLNATNAALAAAAAIPLLLLLYFLKLRRVTMPVGSTLLWKKAIQDLQVNSPFQKLRRNILLLLQLLALLALLLALARPVSEGTPLAGAKSVILIDHSASMNATDGEGGGTRLDEAKRRAGALIGTMQRGAEAMVIGFDDELGTNIAQGFTGDAQALRDAIDRIHADRPADAAQDGLHARQLEHAVRPPDGNRSGKGRRLPLQRRPRAPASDVAELSLRGRLHYERVGKADTKNLAVVAASARRNYERPTEVQVFARVNNFGPEPVGGKVRVSVARIDPDDAGQGPGLQARQPCARWTSRSRRPGGRTRTGKPPTPRRPRRPTRPPAPTRASTAWT